jgi:flavin reductase (DIM6/NTAB) family NADH-FMN oxidoreductase RutF
MTVNSFVSVSLQPTLVSVCLQKTTETARAVIESAAFGISILAADQRSLSARFAGFDPAYPSDVDRFTGVKTHAVLTGAPLLTDALCWLDCKVWAVYDGSTHHIVVGEVVAASVIVPDLTRLPLIYYNRDYHHLTPQQQEQENG